jgi:hypothetical protein
MSASWAVLIGVVRLLAVVRNLLGGLGIHDIS